ncbi:hypothetical protein Csp2054_10765 [Curtobacterium sp. 'Ferrero']|uniref:hypothetical protein n=1 Tax=Curtobacterium sp. 'Ferrero' TaxID=2033654 RepID=UPI000BDB9664|nr:hypothetical protein [Curtobacterium sp. 'Ferrero']PCN47596.1 hypothetical protein Csp2054_10765 [Curtobacterium sp. 'Ferrero']
MNRAFDIDLIRTRGLTGAERRTLERRAADGVYERVRPGVLVRAHTLADLRADERHALLIRATAPYITEPFVLSHESACALLGLPVISAWPDRVHAADSSTGTTRVTARLTRHGVRDRPVTAHTEVLGFRTTTAARTAVDIASRRATLVAVPIVDHVLRTNQTTRAALQQELSRLQTGGTKARAVVEMASTLSGSPAESMCRVRFRQLGTPEPVQQHGFHRSGERSAVVDFWFPDQGVVVEVDGRAKYEDPDMLAGSTTAEAHWREKQREDFIRSFPEVRFVVRLTWTDLLHPERIRAALRRAGVPCR